MKMNTTLTDNFSHLDNFGLSLRNESDIVKSMDKKKTVLVAVTGTSPSVLTETVWALYKEKPDYLPDEIYVCSTSTGVDKVIEMRDRRTTGGSTVWQDLQKAVGKEMTLNFEPFLDKDGKQLADIKNSKDQQLVADQLLDKVRSLKHPDSDVFRIVCSIAGGRKSMSALMYAVMNLAGDVGDIITHVLVPDNVTACPDFFYPGQVNQKLMNRAGEEITAKDVQVELAEIPFVPLRSLLGDKQRSKAKGTFATLVKRARAELVVDMEWETKIRVSTTKCAVEINGKTVELKPNAYLLMAILVTARMEDSHRGVEPGPLTNERIGNIYDAIGKDGFVARVVGEGSATALKEELDTIKTSGTAPANFTKTKNLLKDTLRSAGFAEVADDALPSGKVGFIRIRDVDFANSSPRPGKAGAKKKASKKQ